MQREERRHTLFCGVPAKLQQTSVLHLRNPLMLVSRLLIAMVPCLAIRKVWVLNPEPILQSLNFTPCIATIDNQVSAEVTFYDNSTPSSNTNYTISDGNGTFYSSSTFPDGGVTHTFGYGVHNITYEVEGANDCISYADYVVCNVSNPGVGVNSFGNTSGCPGDEFCFLIGNIEGNHPLLCMRFLLLTMGT